MSIPSVPPVTIASRQAFHDALAAARAEVQRLRQPQPDHPALAYVAQMLDTMARKTANGREPTLEERRGTRLGALVDRELQPPASQEQAALNELLLAVNLYFMVWPPDGVDPEEMPKDEFLARI